VFLKSSREEESIMKLFVELGVILVEMQDDHGYICPEQGSPGGALHGLQLTYPAVERNFTRVDFLPRFSFARMCLPMVGYGGIHEYKSRRSSLKLEVIFK